MYLQVRKLVCIVIKTTSQTRIKGNLFISFSQTSNIVWLYFIHRIYYKNILNDIKIM